MRTHIEEFFGTEEYGLSVERRKGLSFVIAAHALALCDDVPRFTELVHGSIRRMCQVERVNCAWLVLPNKMIWEPVTGMYHVPAAWMAMSPETYDTYGSNDVVELVREHGHWGPWPADEDES